MRKERKEKAKLQKMRKERNKFRNAETGFAFSHFPKFRFFPIYG